MDLSPHLQSLFPQVPQVSQGWGAYPAPQQSPAAGVPAGLQQGSPPKVLGTSAALAHLTELPPLARQVYLTTSRATGRKSRLPSSFDAKSRNILPANRIAPFWPPPPLQETVFLSPAKRAAPAPSPTPRRKPQAPADAAALGGFSTPDGAQCLAKSGHRDAGRSGRAHRRRGPGRFPSPQDR